MASKPSLFNRVASLYARGNTKLLQIVNKIRATPGGKSINVRYIRQNYYAFLASQKAAKDVGSVPPNTPINKAIPKDAGRGSNIVRVSFHVYFNFPPTSKSGKQGRNAVHMVEDFPGGTTKAQILSMLRQKIKDWREQHYESESGNQSNYRIVIDSLRGL